MSASVRVAVFSDVHGNLQGLQSVLAAIEHHGPFDRIVAAGDHCLNGPDPVASLDTVMDTSTDMLIGNTDRDIVDRGASDPDLGDKKADSIAWTRRQLGPERIGVLAGLAFCVEIEAPDGSKLKVVHANPQDVDRHIFPDMEDVELAELVGEVDASMLAFGHLHIPFTRQFGDLMLVNIASAGLPRDGDRRATWGQFSWAPGVGWSVVTHRVEYPYQETVQRMFANGMPHPERRSRDLLRATYE
ncbi:metallophosphoesterase family protein [soil metagenome]